MDSIIKKPRVHFVDSVRTYSQTIKGSAYADRLKIIPIYLVKKLESTKRKSVETWLHQWTKKRVKSFSDGRTSVLVVNQLCRARAFIVAVLLCSSQSAERYIVYHFQSRPGPGVRQLSCAPRFALRCRTQEHWQLLLCPLRTPTSCQLRLGGSFGQSAIVFALSAVVDYSWVSQS